MRFEKPVVAVVSMSLLLVGLSLLSGCGGGSSHTTTSTTTTTATVTTPTVSSTITSSNAGPGVQPGATATSGTGAAGTTTSGSNPSSTTQVNVTSIDLQPATATLEANRQLSYSALAKDVNGNSVTVPDANWKWTSSNPAVAVLTSTGDHATISGVAAGTATITVLEGKSGVTAQATLTVIAAGTDTGTVITTSTGSTGSSGITGTTSTGTGTGTGTGPGPTSTLFYANDFSKGAGSGWSQTTVSKTPGTAAYPSTPFLGAANGFGNGTVSLSLASLPVHSTITLELDVFIIQTWDGNNTTPGIGPDTFTISTDSGLTLLYTTFANITPIEALGYPGSVYQSFPDSYNPAAPINHLYQTGASRVSELGYTHNTTMGALPSDAVYHLKYTFPHTASSIKLNFISGQTQAPPDEGWGLKNVQVTTNP